MRNSYWLAMLVATGMLVGTGVTLAEDGGGRAARQKERETAQKDREAKKAARQERKTQKKATDATTAATKDHGQKRVDRREARQEQRIEQGVQKGSLTADEAAKLEAQQKSIADMETRFQGDGKLSADEVRQLKTQLDTASTNIWADKRNVDGVQQPVSRLGKDVTLNPDVAAKLGDPNLSRADAKAFTHDLGRTVQLKRILATEDLTPERRTQLQGEYNDLLSKYFVATPTPATTK